MKWNQILPSVNHAYRAHREKTRSMRNVETFFFWSGREPIQNVIFNAIGMIYHAVVREPLGTSSNYHSDKPQPHSYYQDQSVWPIFFFHWWRDLWALHSVITLSASRASQRKTSFPRRHSQQILETAMQFFFFVGGTVLTCSSFTIGTHVQY